MEKLQPVHFVLLGMLMVGLVVGLFALGYGIGKDIAEREPASATGVR